MPPCPAPSLKLPSENIFSSFGSLPGAGVCETPISPLCVLTQKCNEAMMSHPISSDICVAVSVACLNVGVVWVQSQSIALHFWGLCASPMRHRDMDQG